MNSYFSTSRFSSLSSISKELENLLEEINWTLKNKACLTIHERQTLEKRRDEIKDFQSETMDTIRKTFQIHAVESEEILNICEDRDFPND